MPEAIRGCERCQGTTWTLLQRGLARCVGCDAIDPALVVGVIKPDAPMWDLKPKLNIVVDGPTPERVPLVFVQWPTVECSKGMCACPATCDCVGFGCDHAGAKLSWVHPKPRKAV